MVNWRIIDTTPAARPVGCAMEPLAAWIGLTLRMGVALVEVTPDQFAALAGKIPAGKLTVRVASRGDLRGSAARGACSFVASADLFRRELKNEREALAVTVELPSAGWADWGNAAESSRAEWARGCGGFRLAGLSGLMAGDFGAFFASLRSRFGSEICLDISDADSCATAACVEWLLSGGRAVCASFAGLGGGGLTEEVLAALNVIAGADFDLTGMPALRQLYECVFAQKVQGFKAVAGPDIFAFESGIHADGIFKNPANYEPFRPENVGGCRRLVIGKHSGREAVRVKLMQLGLPADDLLLTRLNERIRRGSVRLHRSLRDEEIRAAYRLSSDERGDGR